jgi:2-keto-4-pentenoate hydratase/2-oxohepta-3-ene-1,7-dioic acid hydratase in catechol pathway
VTRWVRFRAADGAVGFGTLHGDHVVEHTGEMFASSSATGRSLPSGTFTLLNPCQPSKIVALWNNFHALAAKLGKSAPAHPLFLLKPASCVIGPGEPIQRPRAYSGKIAFEGELAIVIGRRCKDVPTAEAAACIFGYTCVNDVTAAEVLNENGDFAQWCRSKGYDTFGCLGPAIATDFDWAAARVTTRLDGVERQNYPLADMIIPPTQLVSLISQDMTLLPGDVVAVGTSLGVGSMKDGATVQVQIDGIGVLSNTVRGSVAA